MKRYCYVVNIIYKEGTNNPFQDEIVCSSRREAVREAEAIREGGEADYVDIEYLQRDLFDRER